jgi:hypothetical protein
VPPGATSASPRLVTAPAADTRATLVFVPPVSARDHATTNSLPFHAAATCAADDPAEPAPNEIGLATLPAPSTMRPSIEVPFRNSASVNPPPLAIANAPVPPVFSGVSAVRASMAS